MQKQEQFRKLITTIQDEVFETIAVPMAALQLASECVNKENYADAVGFIAEAEKWIVKKSS